MSGLGCGVQDPTPKPLNPTTLNCTPPPPPLPTRPHPEKATAKRLQDLYKNQSNNTQSEPHPTNVHNKSQLELLQRQSRELRANPGFFSEIAYKSVFETKPDRKGHLCFKDLLDPRVITRKKFRILEFGL